MASVKSLVLLAAAFIGCQTTEKINGIKTYKKSMVMAVNGVKSSGVFIADRADKYAIDLETPQKPDYVKITSCHRELILKDNGKEVRFLYEPIKGVEDTEACLLEIAAFDKAGEHLWGLIGFQLGEKMGAIVGCNGLKIAAIGASICQARVGLVQTIEFYREVTAHKMERCTPAIEIQPNKFIYEMNEDTCIYLFSDGENLHRLTTFGYTEVLINND